MTDLPPPYCCGECPPIEADFGGGYDCTCLLNPNCPEQEKRLGVALFEELVNYDWPITEQGMINAQDVARRILNGKAFEEN